MTPGDPSEVVGPVPEGRDPDEYDRTRRRVLWSMPTGLYLVGSRGELEGQVRVNLMTANLVTQVSVAPKLVAVAVDAGALTRTLIDQGRAFSVCMLSREDRALVRKFVKPAASVTWDGDGRAATVNGFAVTERVTGSPVLVASPAWLDCELRQAHLLGSHVLFVGEVVDADGVGAGEHTELLRMEDTRMSYGG